MAGCTTTYGLVTSHHLFGLAHHLWLSPLSKAGWLCHRFWLGYSLKASTTCCGLAHHQQHIMCAKLLQSQLSSQLDTTTHNSVLTTNISLKFAPSNSKQATIQDDSFSKPSTPSAGGLFQALLRQAVSLGSILLAVLWAGLTGSPPDSIG